ncbi:DUF3347 domain-containing protein [Chryseobacterium wangxinyae]|uniref:DUF3347 domain-containing protein n=1 Tax=Chryseobacterium sp. CY350 TaxID=2997336 RepID=UPI00226E112E|nr:DUF3347 domain-containing protein [Chryseobacterium sp. CY350]MCY0978486.1 DUF3347 domain-containing protein [Chryseobacterium sp. CY350]WBZ96258.1 DUF3347 domain-containing protein [Chryseobacterium sp. CY350]
MKKYIITFLFVLIGFVSTTAQSKSNPQLVKLYQNYLSVKSALASDDVKKTSMAAGEFLKTSKTVNAKMIAEKNLISLKTDATTIAQGKKIETQRKAFYNLSDIMIGLAKENKLSDKTIFVQYCPMAKGSWLSSEKQIVNPYYGKSMLDCGSVKSEIK